MDKETTKSFELKHEQLIKEEKEIKDKLDNEVTKIKSKLEEHLSLANSLIRNLFSQKLFFIKLSSIEHIKFK